MNFEIILAEVALLLKLSERRIRQLVDDGIISKLENGNFDVRSVAEDYYRFKFNAGASRDYEVEKTAHERLKRQKTEILVARMKNDVHDAEQVEMIVGDMVLNARSKILTIPSKLAPQLLGIKNLNKISELIENELRLALEELSDYDPAKFLEGCDIADDSDNEKD